MLACCGAVDLVVLGPGELITVEAGHLVAYQEAVQCRLRARSASGDQSVRTGEGLVLDFVGPGQVLTQSHSPRVSRRWPRWCRRITDGREARVVPR